MATNEKKRKTLTFVCIVLFFDTVGLGLILPVMPELIVQLTSLSNSHAAKVSSYLLVTYACMQFLCAPILGAISDRIGRRPVLLASMLGFGANYLLMAIAPTLILLFAARAISGAFGATYSAASACIADVTDPEERARYFGLAGAAMGVGFVAGPALGGLFGELNPRLPFALAGVCILTATVYGWFNFQETLEPKDRRKFDLNRANPAGSITSLSRHPSILLILVALFCLQVSKQSYVSIWPFFTIEIANWSPVDIGISTAVYGLMLILVQGLLLGTAIRLFGSRTTLMMGLCLGCAGFIILSFAMGPIAIYFGIILGGFSELAMPVLQSTLTRRTPLDAQGELQGAISSSYSMSAIIGPFVMAHAFATFTNGGRLYFPGAPFVIAAALVMIAIMVLSLGMNHKHTAPASLN